MRHGIRVEGNFYQLRPVVSEDAGFIVQLRNDAQRTRLIHRVSPHVSDQEEWLKRYFERPGDYYFIIERKETGRAEGTAGIYDVDLAQRCAEWGRWVLQPDSNGAVESAILIYRAAFDLLGLDMLYCRTTALNAKVVLFHKSFGLTTHARLPSHFDIGGVLYDAIEQRLTRDTWERNRAALESKAYWITRLASNNHSARC